MAFGKNPNLLTGVAPFGGNAAQKAHSALNKPKYATGKRIPYFADGYSPTKAGTDVVRLVPGQYRVARVSKEGTAYEEEVPWFEFIEHYSNTHKRGVICSAGAFRMDRNKRELCYGCEIFWEDYSERKRIAQEKGVKRVDNPKRVSMSEKFVFTTIDMGMFYKKDRVNEHGQFDMNPKTNQPYYDWTKLRNPQDPAAYGKETKQGRLQSWTMSKTWFKTLNAYADAIGQSCVGCGNKDCLSWVVWQCGNPECGMPLIRSNACTYTDEQLQEITRQPCMCPHCGIVSYMEEVVQCKHCVNAQRAGIFDVDLEISQSKDPRDNSAILVISGWSQPRAVDPAYSQLYKPLDLPTRFKPHTLEEQSEALKYYPSQPAGLQQPAPQTYAQQYGQQTSVGVPAATPQQPMTQPGYPQHVAPVAAPAPVPTTAPNQGYYTPPQGGQQ